MFESVIQFQRLFGSFWFNCVESAGHELRYRLSGPSDESTRSFCKDLMDKPPVTREEIKNLDNGQLPDALVNAGGYGCRHYWVAEVAA